MKKLLLILFVFLFFTSQGWCQILTFEFATLSGNEVSATSNFNDANLSSSIITRGNGLTAATNSGRFNATNWALTSISNAISGNNYMEFTITPLSNYQFSVSSITINIQRSSTGPSGVALRSSVDSYASNLDQEYSIVDNTSTQTFTFTFNQSNSSSPITYRFYMWAEAAGGSGGIGDGVGNDIVVNGTTSASGGTPNITITPMTLSNFQYIEGSGPSMEQSFLISGSDLSDDITITPSANYEISTGSGGFFVATNPIILSQSGGNVAETSIYVRLKAGLAAGTYNSENITAITTGATDRTVSCSGTVYKLEPTNHVTSFVCSAGNPDYGAITLTWNDASVGTLPDGYLIKGSMTSILAIVDPIDGTAESNNTLVQNITQGTQAYSFSGLESNTTYYFKIYPYTNSGTNINYKTDGTVPSDNYSTAEAPAPTLLLEDNFNYTAGTNLTDNGWTAHSGSGTNPITVAASGLTFTNYSSTTGNAALVDNTGEDINRTFSAVTSGSVFYSFLIKVDAAPTTAGYFTHFDSNPATAFRGRVWIQNNSGDLKFGLSFGNNTPTMSSINFSFGTTYLLVLKYKINTGTTNDAVSLFIFNDGENFGTEPVTPSIGPLLDATLSDINPGMIALRQFDATQNITIDGLRVSAGWSQAPLPVELTHFDAMLVGNKVQLNWSTATEVNNYGFEILRSTQNDWEKVGFVAGHGNSNSPKDYSFTDANAPKGNVSYRLKQIDTDGSFSYSDVTSVNNALAKSFKLYSPYPNPFNPSTTIKYSIPSSSNVSLKIYDVIGNEVASLVNEKKDAGEYEVNFNAKDLPSGIYFSTLRSNGNVQTQKLILIK